MINNENDIYHRIGKLTFSTDGVNVRDYFIGTVTATNRKGSEVVDKVDYPGLVVTLAPNDNSTYIGTLQIVGENMLGNTIKVNTEDLILKNYKLDNHLKISKTYLKKV